MAWTGVAVITSRAKKPSSTRIGTVAQTVTAASSGDDTR